MKVFTAIIVAATIIAEVVSVPVESRISNGQDTYDYYYINVSYSDAYNNGGEGGGVAIGNNWVLTSASIIKGYSSWILAQQYCGANTSTYAIAHPLYRAEDPVINDIGLIRAPWTNCYWYAIALPPAGIQIPLENEEIAILGNGRINNYVEKADTLQVGYQRVINSDTCNLIYYGNDTSSGHFCAQGLANACHGDVGGPATVVYQGVRSLAGIISVSSGNLDCESHGITGFTNVSAYRKWIKTLTKL